MTKEKTLAYLHWEKLVQNNDFAQADRFYEKMRENKQLDAEVCYVMGLWYRQMERYEQAADAFVQGLTIKPSSSDLYYELGNTMREMGVVEGAEQYYRYTLLLRPDHLDALYALGQSLAELEEPEEAAKCFCRAFRLALTGDERIAIAVELSNLGLADQAIQLYFASLLREPDNYFLYSNLGIEFAEQGDFDDAVFCHEKALAMNDSSADLWYNAACTFSLMGEVMQGLLALEKAIALDDANRQYAQEDMDLENLQKHKRFWKLVRGN